MKRIICSLVVLSVILLFCCWSLWKVDRICSDTEELLLKAEQRCMLGDYDGAEEILIESRKLWQRNRGFLGLALRQTEADDVVISFPSLLEVCRQKDAEEFSLRNRELMAILSNLAEMEWPRYYHIL